MPWMDAKVADVKNEAEDPKDKQFNPAITIERSFTIYKTRDRLQVRLRKDHLEGYSFVNLPQYELTDGPRLAARLRCRDEGS